MPNLTAEELHALEDELNYEQTLVKKYRHYAQTAQDQQIKTTCNQIADQHKQHFDSLMGFLY